MATAGAFLATAYHGQTLNDNYNTLEKPKSNATNEDHEYEERTLTKTPQEIYSLKTEIPETHNSESNTYNGSNSSSNNNTFFNTYLTEYIIEHPEIIPELAGGIMATIDNEKIDLYTLAVSEAAKIFIKACNQESKHKKILKKQNKQLTESTVNHLFDTFIPQK